MEIRIMISEILRGLGRPNEAELSESDILMDIWQSVSYYRSLLNIPGEAWDIRKWPFVVDSGNVLVKNITADGFSSSIFVTSKDDTNPYFIQRTIDVVRPDQLSSYWSGPTNLLIGSAWYRPHVAAAFAIYNENGQWKISWLPAHQQSCEYMLWYSPGATTSPFAFEDNSGFPIEEANFLILNDCIVNLFPHLADPEVGLNAKQRMLFDIADKKIQQYLPVFEARRWDGPRREVTTRRKLFGQSRASARGLTRSNL